MTRRTLLLVLLLLLPGATGAAGDTTPALEGRDRASTDAEWIQVYVVLDEPGVIATLVDQAPATVKQSAPARAAFTRARLKAVRQAQAALLPRLAAQGARILGRIARVANAVQVAVPRGRAPALAALPGVARVSPVGEFHLTTGQAVPRLGADALWAADVPVRGDGLRLGIIDSGVDYTHADLGGTGAGYEANDPNVLEPGSFPTARVDGRDLVGDAYDPSHPGRWSPVPDPDPLDCGGHGTHVAGIAAGNGVLASGAGYDGPYEQSLDPGAFAIYPGVAPRASIYAIKVTGCGGGSAVIGQAFELAADPDGDGDLADRLDVVNLSMGSAFDSVAPEEEAMARSLIAAGTVLVAAAGNDGNLVAPFFTHGAPASVTEVISVAATLNQEQRYLALTVDAPADLAGPLPAMEGGFSLPLSQVGPVTGQLVPAVPPEACTLPDNAAELAGQVALIWRGGCTFVEKFQAAAEAGATAVVIADHSTRDTPWQMGGNGWVALPGVLIRRPDGEALAAAAERGVQVTLDAAEHYPLSAGPDYVTEFSSRGPRAQTGALKPDVAAPGSRITSARVAAGSSGVRMDGTSMASPFVAGAATLVRQARPALDPAAVKAALMNTAADLRTLEGFPFPASLAGAGRVDVTAAAAAPVLAYAASPAGAIGISFGALVAARPASAERAVVVDKRGAAGQAIELGVELDRALPGVALTVTPDTLDLQPGEATEVTLTLDLNPDALGDPGPDRLTPAVATADRLGRHYLVEASGRLVLQAAGATDWLARVPFHAAVRAAGERMAGAVSGCADGSADVVLDVPLEGTSAHPAPATSAFALLAEHPAPGVRALGVATDVTTASSFALASAYFGVALERAWAAPAGVEGISSVYLLLDRDLDGEADYLVDTTASTVDPLTGQATFLDAPVVRIFNLETGKEILNDRLVNLVPPDVLDTQLYHNDVLVLPLALTAMGLTAEDTELAVAVLSGADHDGGDPLVFHPVDLRALVLDTTRFGLPGRVSYGWQQHLPLFGPDTPLQVALDGAAADAPPPLLLLHHTNAPGQRVEVVDLPHPDDLVGSDLSLAAEAPAEVPAGLGFAVELTVSNAGGRGQDGVELTVSTAGLIVRAASPAVGACERTAEGAACDLGTLGPDSAVAVTLALTSPTAIEDGSAFLHAEVTSASRCERDPEDNALGQAIALSGSGPPREVRDPGCGCQGGGSGHGAGLAIGGGLLLALARQRARH